MASAGARRTVAPMALSVPSSAVPPVPPAPTSNPGLPVNVNYVFGINDKAPQTWMQPHLFFGLMLTALPLMIWVPTHHVLKRFVVPARHVAWRWQRGMR